MSTVLGWCIAGQHRSCPKQTANLECSCTVCGDEHGVDYEPLPPPIDRGLHDLAKKYGIS